MNLLIPLFSPATGTWGGLSRAVAVAHAAEAASHRVAFCASGYLAANLRRRGYRVYTMPAPTMLGLPRILAYPLARVLTTLDASAVAGRLLGSIWGVLLFSGVLSPRYLTQLTAAETSAARDYGPDVIFTDLDPAAFITARTLRLPIATIYNSSIVTGHGGWAWRRAKRILARILARAGLPNLTPDELFFGHDVLKLVPSTPELDGTDPTRPDVFYVGQLLGVIEPNNAGAFQPEPEQRYVFCYFGLGSTAPRALKNVLAQVFAHDERLCIVSGYRMESDGGQGTVRYCPYVDVRALLPQCDWTICHGGLNTIIQSLQAGVPLVIFPGANAERRQNAAQVQAQGAAWVGEPKDWNASWLRAHLAERKERAAQAMRLSAAIQTLGGPPAAVSAIETWMHRDIWRRENGESREDRSLG